MYLFLKINGNIYYNNLIVQTYKYKSHYVIIVITESEAVRRILYGGYPPSTIQPLGSLGNPATLLQRRQQDVDNVRRAKFINKYPRGDFLIHPEYPPSFPHHRID
jgi:hypothetical protein